MLQNYFRAAWRNLWKNRSVNWINIIGLSAGMTSAVLIFLWVRNELTYDNYHPNADRIYRTTAYLTKAQWVWSSSPVALADAIKKGIPEVEETTHIQTAWNISFHIRGDFFPEKSAAYIDKKWFDLFHYDFIAGNPTSLFQEPFGLLLTESKAKKYFGKTNPIGKTIRIDTADYRVQAIIKDNPANSSFQYDVLIPFDAYLSDPDNRKDALTFNNYNCQTYLKTRAGADQQKIAGKVTGILTQNNKKSDVIIKLEPLKGMHFETGLTSTWDITIAHANRTTVYIFSVLGIFLLVIACINYVNLTTARASLRAKEVSIRKIVGAGRQSLFVQFILESLLISSLSILLTLLLVWLTLPWYEELTRKHFANSLISAGIWKIIGITLLTATILNGIYPAILLSSFRPLNVFKGSSILKVKDVWFRKSLVILQFTFSVILIISTIIIQRQLNFIQNTNLGYQRAQLFSFYLPWQVFKGQTESQKGAMLSNIKQELLSQTSISGTTVASQSIVALGSSNSGSADWDGHDTTYSPTVYQLSADEDYKKIFQIELAQGRWFQSGNPTDRHNFIVNETVAREFNIRKPILGQRFSFQGDTGKIIGIVKDFHFASLHNKIAPLVIMNRIGRSTFFIKTQPGKATQALAAAKTLWQRYNPGKPFEYSFLDEEFDKLYSADEKLSTLILVFSVIAILISSLGLFGLSAFTAEQRTKEIGIRKVLGATVTSLVTLLSKDFIRLVGLSILIASPVAWWAMHRWLQDFAYHIPVSISIFALAGALAIFIALATISFQSVKEALSNPVKSLRSE